jgi:hypothetical protein
MSAVGISPCRLLSSRKSLDGVRPGWSVPSSEWPSICVELSPCPATRCALGNPGENASQPHMSGSAVLSQSTGKFGHRPNRLRLKIHLRASFPGFCLFVIRLLQSAGSRRDAQTLRATKRGGKRLVKFCGETVDSVENVAVSLSSCPALCRASTFCFFVMVGESRPSTSFFVS